MECYNFEVILAALLSPDNTTRSQAEVRQERVKGCTHSQKVSSVFGSIGADDLRIGDIAITSF